jgi:hypothetical protein
MYRYRVMKNGYLLCMAKGLKDAVKKIAADVKFYHQEGELKWKNVVGQIKCTKGYNEYETIRD